MSLPQNLDAHFGSEQLAEWLRTGRAEIACWPAARRHADGRPLVRPAAYIAVTFDADVRALFAAALAVPVNVPSTVGQALQIDVGGQR